VSLRLEQPVPFKTYFKVCGGTEQLGNWDLEAAPAMEWSEGDVWSLDIISPAGAEIEYKLVKVPRREAIQWENGQNRKLVVPEEEVIQYSLVFDKPEATQPVKPRGSIAAAAAAAPAPVEEAAAPANVEEAAAPTPTPAQAPEQPPEKVVEALTEALTKAKQEGVSEADALAEAVREAVAKAKEEGKAEAEAAARAMAAPVAAAQSSSSGKVVAASSTWKEENGNDEPPLDLMKLSLDLVAHVSPIAGAVKALHGHLSRDGSGSVDETK